VPGAEVPQSSLGYPTFHGSDQPVPDTGVDFAPRGHLTRVLEQDLAAGAGTDTEHDFWMDRMLARTGPLHDATEDLVAFTRGRAAFMKTHQPTGLGWQGDLAYWETLGKGGAYAITVSVDGQPVTLAEQPAERKQTPSYARSTFTGGGLRLVQTKFITEQDVVVADLALSATDGVARDVRLTATSGHATLAAGDELTGAEQAYNDVTTVFPRLSGDGFTVDGTALVADLPVPASGEVTTKVQLGLLTEERPETAAEYERVRAASPAAAYTEHVTAYNRWWADNLVYLDTPEDNIDKTLFYRWWLMRYNYLDADVPGNDYQFPTSMEGVLGYNNAIVLTVGMFIDDLKYFRDPVYSYGPALSVGETSGGGKFVDNPGDPANWSNSYTQYITEAAWRAYALHGGPGAIGATLGRHSQDDVEGLLAAYDSDGDDLIEYSWGAMTGNDADAVSFHWRPNQKMDRTESAYLYSNATAAASFYRTAGMTEQADHMTELAQRVRTSVLENLWEDERADADQVGLHGNLLKHQMTSDGALNPWKEINNYYPFSVGLMPQQGDADYDPKYVEALRLFADADQYPVFPFYTANQVDQENYGGPGSNNFSVINSTVWFRMLSSVLRDYPSDYVTPEMYKQLLYWNAWSHYQGDGDNRMPNQNEFWSNGSAADGGSIGYRSWIHHTILGATNFTVIEDAMGFRARDDGRVELDPIDLDWPYFVADNIRYHDRDVTVVWDEDGTHYGDAVPAGYSVFLDGQLAFTVDDLAHVVYDPATGEVTLPEGGAQVVTATTAQLGTASDVVFPADARVVDVFGKAGTDIAPGTTGAADVAQGASVTATFEAAGRPAAAAVDGSTANEPFWGTAGSPNATDAIEIDLGAPQPVDDVRLYFYRSSTSGTVPGYAAPALYTLEYDDGGTWVPVTEATRTPTYPRANENRVQLQQVTTQRLRVTVRHADGARTGLKEVQVRATGAAVAPAPDAPPSVRAYVDPSFSQPAQARLVGHVADDGRPAGQLTSRWEVTGAPEGGDLVIATPARATTVVQGTVEGRYTLRLTADDGAQQASTEVAVDIVAGATSAVNVAPQATATASAVTSWNRVAAINDENAPWPVTAESDAWGTWGTAAGPGGTYTATLTWPEAVRTDSTRVLFHSNGAPDGVLPPSAWSLEYLTDDGTTWAPVPEPDGYPTAAGDFVTVRHAAVSTTALRMTLTRAGQSYPGIVEWQVLAQQPTEVEAPHVRTVVGRAPALPEQVEVTYADGSRVATDVSWQDVDPARYAAEGSFTVSGFVAGTSSLATATVWVRPEAAVQINTFAPVTASTRAGTAPRLPARVVATYNDGSSASVPVTWDTPDPAAYAEPGSLTVLGTVEGTDKRPEATVTVLAPPSQAPVVTLTTDPAVPASQWFAGPVQVTAAATDDDDPAPVVEAQVDDGAWAPYTGALTVAGDGAHTVRARATDASGAVSEVRSVVVRIDGTAPEVTATFDETRRRLTLQGRDTGSGVAALEYAVGDGAWRTYTAPVGIDAGGTVRHRATDVAGNVSAEGTLVVPAPGGSQPVDVAGNAVATVSASTAWNRAAGINDGVDTVPVASQASAWGTWNLPGETQWAQLTWDEPVRVGTSRVLFFDDGGGMRVPASWTLEYLTEDGVTWAPVPDASPLTATAGSYDEVTHAPVTTTALRATLTKPAEGWVGIVEWGVLTAPTATLALSADEVTAGEGLTVDLTGGAPRTTYAVTLDPGATSLGSLVTDAAGAGRLLTAPVPRNAAGGDYTVTVAAADRVLTAPLTVVAATDPGPGEVVAGTVAVTGDPAVGAPLEAVAEGWGPEGVRLAWQWFVGDQAVAGATGTAYTPVPGDVGQAVTVRATGFADGLRAVAVTSAPTAPVAPGTIVTGTVGVAGEPTTGATLRAQLADWQPGTTLEYQWWADGEPVAGATGAELRLRPQDRGATLTLRVRASAPGWTTTPWVESAPVGPVGRPLTTHPVRIVGVPLAGLTLTARTEPWGPGRVALSHQWYRDGEPIAGATGERYRLTRDDRGHTVTVAVTGERTGWTTATRTSDGVPVL